MFDLLRSIAAGFGGKLKESPEARRLVWVLIVALFFSGCCCFFIAYVSFSRYRSIAGFLPGADLVAMSFTAGIALFMYYVSAHVAGFAVESWLYGKSRLAWQGVIIFAVAGILVGVIDFRMNLDGAEDVAERSAGVVSEADETGIIARYQTEIERLEARKKAVLQKYWWKGKLYFEAYPVTRHPKKVWKADTVKVNKLDRQIARQEDLKARALADARNLYQSELQSRDRKRTTTRGRLEYAVRGVYFLQFLLTLVTAFILIKMDEALEKGGRPGGSGLESPIGFGSGVVAGSSREGNEIRALKVELAGMKSEYENPRINRGINTGINTVSQIEMLIFGEGKKGEDGPDPDEIAFLRKYKRVVRALLDGKSYGKIMQDWEVSKSTIQNVKRSMKAVKLI